MKRLLLALSCMFALVACTEKNPVLTVEGGQIQGVESDGITIYRGIPFAAAPVGDLRWKEPQPVTPWEGVRICDTFGAPSMQPLHTPGGYTEEFFADGDPEFSEDCLFLNVWTPAAGKLDAKVPVCLWIHGGAYKHGWGHEPEMEGTEWAKHGVVLVSCNYRLGTLGFLTHPALSAESEHGVSGNYGMLDQIAALKWVRNNIEQFGGDPDKITIMGQSAGAFSIKTLVSSPLSKDLVAGAIIQSGGGISDAPILRNASLSDSEAMCKACFDAAGLDTIEKLRAASYDELVGAIESYAGPGAIYAFPGGSPCIDGYAQVRSFDENALAGEISNVPYMIGACLDDMGGLDGGIDRFCAKREEAGIPAYYYHFDRPLPTDGRPDVLEGAFHSSELWYMFKSLQYCWRPFIQGDYDLAEQMVTAWTNFVKTGNPSSAELEWTPWTAENPKRMSFKLSEDGEVASEMVE